MLKPYYEDAGIAIYHGDCLDVLPQLGPQDLILTDPPYGVGVKYGPSYDDGRKDYWEWFGLRVTAMRAAAHTVAFTHRVAALHHIEGWDWIGVWSKPYAGGSRIGNSCVLPHWEPIFLFGIHGQGTASIYTSDVFNFSPEKSGAVTTGAIGREKWDQDWVVHPVPKPLSLYVALLSGIGQSARCVVDPFMGSGTTLRAAKDLGRRAIGIEIEERYCEKAALRMGQEAFSFEETA